MGYTEEGLNTRFNGLELVVDRIVSRLDSLEQIQAIIISMYAEMYATLETILKYISDHSSDDEFKAVIDTYEEIKRNIWSSIMDQSNLDAEAKAALEHLMRPE